MAGMPDLRPVDLIALVLVTVAILRGFYLGLIREAFSLCALAAAGFAVHVWVHPLATWLVRESDGRVGTTLAPWLAGAALAVAVIAAVGILGRMIGRGARAIGLGWADRAGGAALGFAEGAVALGLLFTVISGAIGRHHAFLEDSKSFAVYEQLVRVANVEPPWVEQVSSPPPSS